MYQVHVRNNMVKTNDKALTIVEVMAETPEAAFGEGLIKAAAVADIGTNELTVVHVVLYIPLKK